MSATGIELISFHPIKVQANIMNRKKANNAVNISTAKIATNKAKIFNMVVNI
jgi:hypothetical protein